ncbi:MAG: OadG family protein [Thermotogota bacterium]
MNNVGLITVTGIFTVFTVLLLLMIIYYLFGFFADKSNSKASKKKNYPSPQKIKKVPEFPKEKNNYENDEEIAAITAAVYNFIDSSKYRIKNIKKSNNSKKKQTVSRWGSVSPVNTWRTNR